MRNLLYLLAVLTGFVGCSDDEKPNPSFEGRLPKRVSIESSQPELDQYVEFEYDGRHRLQTMTLLGAVDDVYSFTYDNADHITAVDIENGYDFTFEYDDLGRLTAYTYNNQQIDVVYNAGSQSYEINGVPYVLKENGDMLSEAGMVYHYETYVTYVLKGPFRDVVGSPYHLILYLVYPDSVMFSSKDAFTGRSVPGDPNHVATYSVTNGYDIEDYTMSANYTVFGISFHYSFDYYDPEEL